MTEFFIDILHSSVSAYRKGYSCQHVLLKSTEHWRDAFDADKYVGIVAMDLSKAFDSMPHGLLIAKLHAYGVSLDACNMIISYLINRQQRVKVSGQVSEWSVINRGVPQGSVLGPLLFNLFLNDLFFVELNGNIANYADDNHLYNENACIKKSWYVTLKTTQMFVCLGLKITVWLRILKSSKDLSHPGMVKCPFLFLLMVIPSYLQMKLMYWVLYLMTNWSLIPMFRAYVFVRQDK